MTDRATTRRKAADAARLIDDEALARFLNDLKEEGATAFLVSGGDPERMAAAFDKVRAAETVLSALQTRVSDERIEAQREQTRGPHD